MSILNKQGLKTSKRIQKINTKFRGKQNNFLNQTVHFILQQCLEQDIGTIILGYNKNFQFKSNMGRKQNPNIHVYRIQEIQRKTRNTM